MNQINVVTIGKLIEAHREGDEQKFKTYVDFIVKAYEEQENDRAARIIRSSYTGDYGEQGKLFWMKQTDSEEEALQQLQKHAANYAQRITIYKIDGRTVKREVAEYDQWEKKWMS